MDIKKFKHIHFTGIKGVAMTSLALCAQDMGKIVTGSDVAELFVTDAVLKKRRIKWAVGFGERNLDPRPDLLITTGAHGGFNNSEVVSAKDLGIPVISQAEALKVFSEGKRTISVCGVGGKTTTSSMISVVLELAGNYPSYAIGVGQIFPIGDPGKYDERGDFFICEADEFVVSPGVDNRPKFSLLDPYITAVTNIELDHPDIYPTINETKRAFLEYFNKIPQEGLLVACIDNENVAGLIKEVEPPVASYGFSTEADWRIINPIIKDQHCYFTLNYKKGTKDIDLVISVPGDYNVRNATATFIVGKFLGISGEKLKNGLAKFQGTKRRFEKVGEMRNGSVIYDDYAHHPEEIKSVLAAAKDWFPGKRIVAVFQPHTYSRTKALFSAFSRAFSDADVVGLVDIYSSAREAKDPTVSSELLASETKKYHKEVYYLGGLKDTTKWINKFVREGDVIFTIGAGNIFHVHKNLKLY